MKERSRRLVLWLLAVVVSILMQKGHRISQSGEAVAFLPGGNAQKGAVTIRIEGDALVKPGVYQFGNTDDVGTVINMTVPFLSDYSLFKDTTLDDVCSGDVLRLKLEDGELLKITTISMAVSEKMLLGIPLDPNKITAGEWQELPGIGPSLAKRIVVDRQINGDFATIADIVRVPGIGGVKLQQLAPFFE